MDKKPAKPATKVETESTGARAFDIQEITDLLKAFTKSNVNELKIEKGDYKITIKQGAQSTQVVAPVYQTAAPTAIAAPSTAAQAPAAPAAAPQASENKSADSSNLITVKSPMIGTFYRSAGPGKPAFVSVGDEVSSGKVLCIIEAMKLFNEIESEYSGKIVKVLVDDATPVEYDQPLFLIEP